MGAKRSSLWMGFSLTMSENYGKFVVFECLFIMPLLHSDFHGSFQARFSWSVSLRGTYLA